MVRRYAPTIVDVARQAGVSKSLVSLVLRNSPNVSSSRRAAVLRAVEEIGYRPNAVARSLVRRRSHLLGVMLSDLRNPFFTEVVEGIEEAAPGYQYQALINSGNRLASQERIAIDTLIQLRTDGLILAGPVVSRQEIEKAGRAVPTVVATRAVDSQVVDSVVNDDRLGGQLAVDHLAGLGHRRIAHISGGRGAGAARRSGGYREAMRRHGLERHIQVAEGAYTEEGGAGGMRSLLTRRPFPTAVFAPNDVAAVGALHAIEGAGLRVPEDVSLVGYDNIALAGLGHINLTTIDQPRREMGIRAVELLSERLEEGRNVARHVVVKPTVVVRGTTGPPRR